MKLSRYLWASTLSGWAATALMLGWFFPEAIREGGVYWTVLAALSIWPFSVYTLLAYRMYRHERNVR